MMNKSAFLAVMALACAGTMASTQAHAGRNTVFKSTSVLQRQPPVPSYRPAAPQILNRGTWQQPIINNRGTWQQPMIYNRRR